MSDPMERAVLELFNTPEPPQLGPDRRARTLSVSGVRSAVDQTLAGGVPTDASRQLVVALVLLWHDHLAEAHAIAQAIDSADGSAVHAIMHRREPDYWNSKYWWRHAGSHPAFKPIGRRAGEFLTAVKDQALAHRLLRDGDWNPAAFVDACERVADRPAGDPEVRTLRELQRIEFEQLLRHLVRSGTPG